MKHSQSLAEKQNTMAGLEAEKIVFKPMSYEELNISLERLQRFNNPFRKFDRVYREILIKHLVFPKISLKNYYKFSFGEINYLVQLIWNESVKILMPVRSAKNKENYEINSYLFFEEIKEFSAKEILKRIIFSESIAGFAKPANFAESDFIDDENILNDIFEKAGIYMQNQTPAIENLDMYSKIYIKSRMNYPINIDGFLKIAEKKKNSSKNIKRLIWLNKEIKKKHLTNDINDFKKDYELAEIYRNKNFSRKPLKLLLLVEGSTEETLLPVFSNISGINFEKNGIELIASGGKNQVAKIYSEINQEINLPVFIILDADAKPVADEIMKNIRPQDRLYLIDGGEFEDILPDELICRATNSFYGLTGKINKQEIDNNNRKADALSNLWKQKGFGEFKKSEFAQIITENIKNHADLSEEMQKIILNIKEMISK